jgi:GNAT superfamily N-acetyltransferase
LTVFMLRPHRKADYPRLADIISATAPRPTTPGAIASTDAGRSPDRPFRRLVAEAPDGTVAGFGTTGWEPDQDPGHFYLTIRVDAAYRRQGAGTLLLETLADWARSRGAIRLESTVLDTDQETLACAERQGFVNEGHVYRAVLDLSTWDDGAWREAVTAAERSGIRFTALAEAAPGEDGLRQFHRFSQAMERHVPGRSPVTPDWPTWRAQVESDPHWDPKLVLLALDRATWAAMTQYEHQDDGSLYTHLTAVHPAYRGRGLGLAIKVRALQLAREIGAPYVSTFNHSVNGPMVAINNRLSYIKDFGIYQLYLPLT